VDDASTQFPTVIIGFFYPIGFFVYMRFCQIIQPEAISAISRNEIYASPALNTSIMRILQDEFKHSMSHQWATYIHGKILTRIAATSLKLEQSVNNNDPESFKNGLNNLKMILENPTKDFEQNQMNLRSEVSSRLDPWEGLIKINLSIDSSLENVSNSRVKDVGEAIEEIISNSVRHGGSQNIWINITLLDHPDIQLLIDDDAVNPIPLVLPRIGLGTKILNLVSDGRWSISHIDRKTTVKLVMAVL
jgi:two-component sensor histidine kinase